MARSGPIAQLVTPAKSRKGNPGFRQKEGVQELTGEVVQSQDPVHLATADMMDAVQNNPSREEDKDLNESSEENGALSGRDNHVLFLDDEVSGLDETEADQGVEMEEGEEIVGLEEEEEVLQSEPVPEPERIDEPIINEPKVEAPAPPPPVPVPVTPPPVQAPSVTTEEVEQTEEEEREVEDETSEPMLTAASESPPEESESESGGASEPAKNDTGLPDDVKAQMEQLFGLDISGIRFRPASKVATDNEANALLMGNQIHFAPGKFNPRTRTGKELIGHELAHVKQQAEGKVKATGTDKGKKINDSSKLEAEADRMGRRAAMGLGTFKGPTAFKKPSLPITPIIQKQQTDDKKDPFAEYKSLLSWAEERKSWILDLSTSQKEEVAQRAEAEKVKLDEMAALEYMNFVESIDGTIASLRETEATAINDIETARSSRIEDFDSEAKEEGLRVLETVSSKKTELKQKGESKKSIITTAANTVATDSTTRSNANANAVDSTISAQAAAYGDREGIDTAIAEIRSSGHTTKKELRRMGAEMATELRSEAQTVRSEIGDQVAETEGNFDELGSDILTKMIQKRNETVAIFNDHGTDFISKLRTETNETVIELEGQKINHAPNFAAFPNGAKESIGYATAETNKALEAAHEKTITELDEFIAMLSEIGWYSQEIRNAKSDLEGALGDHETEMRGYIDELYGKFGEHNDAVKGELQAFMAEVLTTLEPLQTEFKGEVTGSVADVLMEMETSYYDALRELATVPENLAPEIDDIIHDINEEWDEKLQEKKEEMQDKLEQGLESQEGLLSDFSETVADSFNSLPRKDPTFWESVGDFFSDLGDFFLGVAQGLWDGVLALWEGIKFIFSSWFNFLIAVLVILAVVGLILLIVALSPAWVTFGLVATVLGVVVGLVVAGYFIYQAITTEGLSPYERGRLVGRAIFEIVLAFIGTGILKRLPGWATHVAKIGMLVRRLGGLGKLIMVISKVDDLALLLKIVDSLGDAAKLMRVMRNVKDANKLLKLLNEADDVAKLLGALDDIKNISTLNKILSKTDDVAMLMRVINKVDDVAAFERLIGSAKVKSLAALEKLVFSGKITEMAQLERLLNLEKVLDAAQLEKILALDKVMDAAQLERLLGLEKLTDAAQLERLLNLDKVLDAAQVEKLLGMNKLTDAAQLEKLLKLEKMADAAQLERLLGLDKVMDAAQLENLLKLDKLVDGAQLERLLALDKVLDGTQLERLLAMNKVTDAAQLERLLALDKVVDAAQVERLLGMSKLADAVQLERLLGLNKVADAAQLERILNSIKVTDAAQVERLLANSIITDGVVLERLLGNVKIGSAGEIESILALGKITDVVQLARLLANIHITDLPHLERLIGLSIVTDMAAFERMLNIIDDVVLFEAVLRNSKISSITVLETIMNHSRVTVGNMAELSIMLGIVDDSSQLSKLLDMCTSTTPILPSGLLTGGFMDINILRSLVPSSVPNTFFPSSTILSGNKHIFRLGPNRIQLKWHSPDANAPAGSNSIMRSTAQIKLRNKFLLDSGGLSNNPNQNAAHIPFHNLP